jgi:hypothetical protein
LRIACQQCVCIVIVPCEDCVDCDRQVPEPSLQEPCLGGDGYLAGRVAGQAIKDWAPPDINELAVHWAGRGEHDRLRDQRQGHADGVEHQQHGIAVHAAVHEPPARSLAEPLKDKSRNWQNYFCLQIKLICILYNYLFLFGSFVVLTKINCLFYFSYLCINKTVSKIIFDFYTIG